MLDEPPGAVVGEVLVFGAALGAPLNVVFWAPLSGFVDVTGGM